MCTCVCTCRAQAVEKRNENGPKRRQKSLQTDPNGGKNYFKLHLHLNLHLRLHSNLDLQGRIRFGTAPYVKTTRVANDFSKFGWATEAEKRRKKKFGSHKCQKDGPMRDHLKPSMLQKVKFWRPIARSWFSKAYFCKSMKTKCIKAKNYRKCILQMTCWMQERIKTRRRQLLCIWLGNR